VKVTIGDLVGPGFFSDWTPLVDPDGTASMPLVPPIPVVGLSTSAVETKIRQAYSDANLISRADVRVVRIEQANATLTGRGPLKAGDKVICHITDLEGPGIQSRLPQTITDNGQITLPHVGNLQIAGKSESEAATVIQDAYRNGNLISNAQVELVREPPKSVEPSPAGVVGGER
jgi:protein involved in polysaccharide export with SLBB domain